MKIYSHIYLYKYFRTTEEERMNFKNLRIGKKIIIGFGCMVVLLALTGYSGFDGIHTVSRSLFIVGDE
jgi:methyl-accepting chemotaxis protein